MGLCATEKVMSFTWLRLQVILRGGDPFPNQRLCFFPLCCIVFDMLVLNLLLKISTEYLLRDIQGLKNSTVLASSEMNEIHAEITPKTLMWFVELENCHSALSFEIHTWSLTSHVIQSPLSNNPRSKALATQLSLTWVIFAQECRHIELFTSKTFSVSVSFMCRRRGNCSEWPKPLHLHPESQAVYRVMSL